MYSPSLIKQSFVSSVSTNQLFYVSGEPIQIKLRISNPSSSQLDLHFVSGYWVDYEIVQYSLVLYRLSDHCIFHQMVWTFSLGPNESYTMIFNHSSTDYLLIAGWYQIIGRIVGYWEGSTKIYIKSLTIRIGFPLIIFLFGVPVILFIWKCKNPSRDLKC